MQLRRIGLGTLVSQRKNPASASVRTTRGWHVARRACALVAACLLCLLASLVGPAHTARADDGITIQYNTDNSIHYITETDASGNQQTIILFCMNNDLHWPHTTESIRSVPNYTKVNLEEFARANGVTDTATFASQLKALLYAGYPYNAMELYEVVDTPVTSVTEEEFNQLLVPPLYLRTDFPDSIGNAQFTYSDYNADYEKRNKTNMDRITDFMDEVTRLSISGSKTTSGLTAANIQSLPFYKAASSMFYSYSYDADPLDLYSSWYGASYYVTAEQAYSSTSAAIWNLMYKSGLSDNSGVPSDALADVLTDSATADHVLDTEPKSSEVSISGDAIFTKASDGKWYTGELTLNAPANYQANFTLTLPEGISSSIGTTIRPGESFRLVSDTKPADNLTITAGASLYWMDGDLRVYSPVGGSSTTAPDDKAFQNMVGAVIKQSPVSATLSVSREDTKVTVTKNWENEGTNPQRPESVTVRLHANGEVVAEATLNADNNWSYTFSDLAKYDEDVEIEYSISEDALDNYSASVVEDGNSFTLTNKYVPGDTSLFVSKEWEDDYYEGRPESITVRLLANGQYTGRTVTLSDENHWTSDFTELPERDDNNVEIVYTVEEDQVEGYNTPVITGTATEGYVIVNTLTPVEEEEDDDDDDDDGGNDEPEDSDDGTDENGGDETGGSGSQEESTVTRHASGRSGKAVPATGDGSVTGAALALAGAGAAGVAVALVSRKRVRN